MGGCDKGRGRRCPPLTIPALPPATAFSRSQAITAAPLAYYDATKAVLTALEANPAALPAGSPLAKPVSKFVATAKKVRRRGGGGPGCGGEHAGRHASCCVSGFGRVAPVGSANPLPRSPRIAGRAQGMLNVCPGTCFNLGSFAPAFGATTSCACPAAEDFAKISTATTDTWKVRFGGGAGRRNGGAACQLAPASSLLGGTALAAPP
jgi:hypothetical protein